DGFGVHPALLDAALHGVALFDGEGGLPFAWSGVSVFAVGATTVRVRISRAGSGFSLLVADGVGQPVAAVDSLVLRPFVPVSGRQDGLYGIEWVPVSGEALTGDHQVVSLPPGGEVRERLAEALALV
ncbi:polyketide synthase dehydratase domain-containing protein, partial [Actinoalloteichus caeruleus]|uniref:polyketide synthase dehydratase domain-containing protein n=1 Tax=Actinoalloteichus cyanogriseus TaxID=2893586 RepID=UPI0005BC1D56